MKKCLKTFVRENNIKFPLSEEMLLYYLSLGYTCVCRQKVNLDYYVYTRIGVKDLFIHSKEFLSCIKLKPLSRSDIRFLIKNLTVMKGSIYYIYNNRDRWLSKIDTTMENIKMMLDNNKT